MRGRWGRAFQIFAAFIGIGFFSAALNRLLNFRKGPMTEAGVTLGTAVLLFAGLRVMKQGAWANTALVVGGAMAGYQLLQRPVTEAGVRVGNWLRSGAFQANGADPSTSYQTQDMPRPSGDRVDHFGHDMLMSAATGSPSMPTGTMPAAPAQAPPSAPSQPQAVNITYEAAKIPKPSTLETIVGGITQLGGAAIGAAFGSAGDRRPASLAAM